MLIDNSPLSVDRVALTVRDLDRVGDFYQRVVGLDRISGDGESRVLGQGERPLLELRRDPNARSFPHEAGLFHTAFLLPERADLGRWLAHSAALGQRLDGASDHLVSEAVYLRDPEGNGIEIYVDRPRSRWTTNGAQVAMDSIALDLDDLLRSPGRWAGAPEGTVVGHVHLQVGDVDEAEAFYHGRLGFDLSATLASARFFATGGYHHHVAANVWNSRGAGPRTAGSAGLGELVLSATPDTLARLAADAFTDPWGNRITIETKRSDHAAAA